MRREPVTVKLFDDKKKCRLIGVVNAIKEEHTDTGAISWWAPQPFSMVFTAHKDTTITHGTVTPDSVVPMLMQFKREGVRIPNLFHMVIKKGCTLTIQFGGRGGAEALCTLY